MSWGYVAVGVGTVAAGYISADKQGDAATAAAEARRGTSSEAISEARLEAEKFREILDPFVQAGGRAIEQQQEQIGLMGPEAQGLAVSRIEEGPLFQALSRQGEQAILQNASATGGLRGGNVQAALAQFRPALLQQLLSERFGQLGNLAQLGQASAAGVGAGGLQSSANIAGLLTGQGEAEAGAVLRRGAAQTGFINDLGRLSGIGVGIAERRGVFDPKTEEATL